MKRYVRIAGNCAFLRAVVSLCLRMSLIRARGTIHPNAVIQIEQSHLSTDHTVNRPAASGDADIAAALQGW